MRSKRRCASDGSTASYGGWDDARYARKFTPRRADSKWSTSNRRRYADLKSRGVLAAPGLRRAPTNRDGDAPRPSVSALPPYIEETLKTVPRAWQHFNQLAPSNQRAYIGWLEIGQAGRDEGKTSPRSTQPIGVRQEARFEVMFGLTTQLYLISTSPMRFTALHANTRLPSAVAIMLRTTPPPDGINHV